MSALEPASSLALRDLTFGDLPRVIAIEESCFSTPWQRSTFEALMHRADADLIGAFSRGELVGYAITWTIMDQSELGNVAVSPDARRRGLGRLLVETALGRVRARGARECFLEVRESNHAARDLYGNLGFEPIGRRRRYYSRPVEDAVVMRKRV